MLDLRAAGFPVVGQAELVSDQLEKEPDWENIDVSGCFDAPDIETLGEIERQKLHILKEMTKRVMVRMQSRMLAMIADQKNLSEKEVYKITETVKRLGMDKPRISVRFGNDAVDMAIVAGVENVTNADKVAKEGLVITQLPEPLAKYWDRSDGGAKKVNWRRIYGQLYDEFWQGVKCAEEQGLYMKRLNKVGVHDPKKYYYVFVPSFNKPFEEIESTENEWEREEI